MNDECREFASAVLFGVEFMTDKEFNDAVKRIRESTGYYRNVEKGWLGLDGFSADVFYDKVIKQYIYMEDCPIEFPKHHFVTKEQFQILKEELKNSIR